MNPTAGRSVQKRTLKIDRKISKLHSMITTIKSTSNQQRVDQLQTMLERVLVEVLQRGFYGTAAIEVLVQDGTIQSVHRKVEQIHR